MKTNTTNTVTSINTNAIMTDVEAVDYLIENRIKKFAERMPGGQFFDHHDDSIDNCDGIVLLADGHVCPTFNSRSRYWSLNPLRIGKDGMAHLSTASCAGVMMTNGTLDKSIIRYNQGLTKQLKDYGIDQTSHMVIAYYEFK